MTDAALEGRVAIVTGASRGIGRAIALALASHGADVAITARTASNLDATAAMIAQLGRRALPVAADSTDETQMAAMFDRVETQLGVPYVMVNNSGVLILAPITELSLEQWQLTIDTNLTGAFLGTREAVRRMVPQREGRIINVASNMGIISAANFSAYSASKSGILGLTRAMALELARHNIQVNAIAPGVVETELNAEHRDDEATHQRMLKAIPARRFGTPEEIGALALQLALPTAGFVTGAVLVADGGESVR